MSKRGDFAPSLKSLPPLLAKERGIKGVRLINNLRIEIEDWLFEISFLLAFSAARSWIALSLRQRYR